MKTKKGLKLLSILLVLCTIMLYLPNNIIIVSANQPEEPDYSEETFCEDSDESEADIGFIGEMTEIPSQGGDTAEILSIDFVNATLFDGGIYGVSDGVYAFENIGNAGLWMDIQQDKYMPGYHMQQYAANGNPVQTFDRSCLFKITRRGSTNSYIIRSMLNNRLTFYFSGNDVLTKEIPPNDADVSVYDTFKLEYNPVDKCFVIKPYSSSNVVAAKNTTASGTAGEPNSNLIMSTESSSGNQARWRLYRYTGETKSGVIPVFSPSTTSGALIENNTYNVNIVTWTTEIGKNTPYALVHPDSQGMATGIWDASTCTLTLTTEKAGPFKLRTIIRADGTTTAFRTFYGNYPIIPDVVGDTTFVKNVGTGKYIDIEGPSTANNAIIQQWQFNGKDQSKWLFEVQTGGYFRIKSLYSNKYIGVDSTATTVVRQYDASSDYTLWRFAETASGTYKLICKAIEASGNVLAVPLNANSNGTDLTIVPYTDDTNYKDEWSLQLSTVQLYDVPHNLRSTNSHLCIPCAITNIMAYWSINGYSQFDCETESKQEQKAIAVQANMNANGSCTANRYIQYGFDIFSHTENGKTYFAQSTNYWCKENMQEFSYSDIIEELNNERPLMLGYAQHQDSPYGGGHMTVCVGYETENGVLYVYVSDAHKDYFVRHKYDSTTYNDFICKVSIVSMEE